MAHSATRPWLFRRLIAPLPHRRRLTSRVHHLSPHLLVGGGIVLLLVLADLLAPVLPTTPPDRIQPEARLLAPTTVHPFGTDAFGRDLFSRTLYGARLALRTSVLTVLLSAWPGIGLGLLAGYYRGWFEQVASRVMDVWLSLPSLLLALVLIARLGTSLQTSVIALGIVGVPSFYRLVRGSTLSARHSLHVEAARAIGASDWRILLRHILPGLTSPLIVLTTLRLGTVVLAVGGLGFIGLGAQPPTPEWGTLLAEGWNYLDIAWWMAFFPGLAITLTVMGFNLLGDGLRDALSPQAYDFRIRRLATRASQGRETPGTPSIIPASRRDSPVGGTL